MLPIVKTILVILSFAHAQMEPISATKLQTMRHDMIVSAKQDIANQLIRDIYNNVRPVAVRGESTQYIHPVQYYTLRDDSHIKFKITLDDVKELILSDLKRLFPGCKVTFVERHPDPIEIAIFDSRRIHGDRSNDIYRAFVIDWSEDDTI